MGLVGHTPPRASPRLVTLLHLPCLPTEMKPLDETPAMNCAGRSIHCPGECVRCARPRATQAHIDQTQQCWIRRPCGARVWAEIVWRPCECCAQVMIRSGGYRFGYAAAESRRMSNLYSISNLRTADDVLLRFARFRVFARFVSSTVFRSFLGSWGLKSNTYFTRDADGSSAPAQNATHVRRTNHVHDGK